MNLELEALLSNEFGWNAHLWLPLPAPPPRAMVSSCCFAAGTSYSASYLSLSVHGAERKHSCALCTWGPSAWAAALACWPHKAALRGSAYDSDGQS